MGKHNKHEECVECEAVYRVKFELDDDYYKLKFCPFCGSESVDEDYEIDEQED